MHTSWPVDLAARREIIDVIEEEVQRRALTLDALLVLPPPIRTVICGPSKTRKTALLIHVANMEAIDGHRVVFDSFEIGETVLRQRGLFTAVKVCMAPNLREGVRSVRQDGSTYEWVVDRTRKKA